jgi:hypothetical protein
MLRNDAPVSAESPKTTEAAESKPPPQSHTRAIDSSELWEKALANLKQSGKHQDIVATIEGHLIGDKLTTPDGKIDASECFRDVKDKISQAAKGLQSGSGTSSFVQKTVSVLNMAVPIGDVAVCFDPVHAALPWAAIRTVLMVSDSQIGEFLGETESRILRS